MTTTSDKTAKSGMFLQTAGLGLQVAGATRQSQAAKAAYRYQAAVSRNNAQIAAWQAKSILAKGATDEQQQRLRTAQMIGAQRARFAANGVALTEGSPLNILDDTRYLGEMDALTVRDNAAKDAWGARVQELNYLSDANMLDSRASAESSAFAGLSTLLTGGKAVADSWYQYGKTKGGP